LGEDEGEDEDEDEGEGEDEGDIFQLVLVCTSFMQFSMAHFTRTGTGTT
jgi:hypothetical protein